MSTSSAYGRIAEALAEVRRLGEAGDWGSAEAIAGKIDAALRQTGFPAAQPGDRSVIEQGLAEIAETSERAGALHGDIARLLAAFGGTPSSPVT
ncbi:MAG: hypothetical protein LBR88_06040 [Zoogloeaceae bacterium]|jgi:hypothetical protein|nr:hypothetical protein [Zoogloeaceae bacterium]